MEITVRLDTDEMKQLNKGEKLEIYRFFNPVKLPAGDLWAIHVEKEKKMTDAKFVGTVDEGRGEMVTVCSSCLQASCWQGIFFCNNAKTAGIVQKRAEELKKLNLEHPSYWGKG